MAPTDEWRERATEIREQSTLPRRQAEVYVLTEECDMSREDVGDTLGIAENTVDEYRSEIRERVQQSEWTVENIRVTDRRKRGSENE